MATFPGAFRFLARPVQLTRTEIRYPQRDPIALGIAYFPLD